MKKSIASTLIVVAGILTGFAAYAGTPNTTAAGAVSYEIGNGWISDYVDETAQNRWFAYKEFAGRSYCIDAAMGSGTYFPLDPNLTLYTDVTGTTSYLTSSDSTIEPPRNKGATICYVSALASGSLIRAFRVNVPVTAGSGDNGIVRVQVIESTLYGESFAFSTDSSGLVANKTKVQLNNHSKTTINATVYLPLVGLLGPYAVPGENGFKVTPTVSTAPNYSYGNPAYIMHDGYAGAISGWFDVTIGTTTSRYYLMQR